MTSPAKTSESSVSGEIFVFFEDFSDFFSETSDVVPQEFRTDMKRITETA